MSKLYRLIILVLVFFSIFSVYFTIPSEDNFAKSADEGYYFGSARLISQNGIGQFPRLAKIYIDKKESRLFPTPLRVGHILATALWFKFFPHTFVSLAKFSFLCFILFLVISFYFARRNFNIDIAYLLLLVLSSSPLLMAMGRRALSDIHLNLYWGLTIWLFLDFLMRQNKVKYFIFILFFSLAITVKESSIVLLIFFVIFFFIHKYVYRQKIAYAYLLGIVFLPLILVGVTYLVLFQGITNTIDLVSAVLDTHFGIQTSRYALLFSAGPWYRYIVDYLLLTPITTLLFIGYFFHILLIRKFDGKIAYFMTYFTTIFLILSNLKYSKVVRFVINLDMVIALFSIMFLYELFKQKNKNRQIHYVFVIATVIFIINYLSFTDIFCIRGVYDPISYNLLSARKFIP